MLKSHFACWVPGFDIDAKDVDDRTPQHVAVNWSFCYTVDLLYTCMMESYCWCGC